MMMHAIRKMLRRISVEEEMQRELDEARRALLEALSSRDHAEASVAYHENRISRLRQMLSQDPAVMTVGGTE